MDDRQLRNAATKAFSRYLASPPGRRSLAAGGYKSETPIVPAHESESIESILNRVANSGGRVVVAVHFPERSADKQVELLHLERGPDSEDSDASMVRPGATIGMMLDEVSGGSITDSTLAKLAQVEAGAFTRA